MSSQAGLQQRRVSGIPRGRIHSVLDEVAARNSPVDGINRDIAAVDANRLTFACELRRPLAALEGAHLDAALRLRDEHVFFEGRDLKNEDGEHMEDQRVMGLAEAR